MSEASGVEDQKCPSCGATVSTGAGLRLSEIIECAECRTELEVASVEPVILVLAPEIEEDWGE